MECPHCGQIDQVQSVQAVYESQTGTYSSQTKGVSTGFAYASGVGVVPTFGSSTSYTSGSMSSRLADAIAPPPPPRMAPVQSGCAATFLGVGSVVPFALLLPFLWSEERTGPFLPAFLTVAALGALAGSAPGIAAFVIARRRRRERKRAQADFESYSMLYPSLMAAWSASVLCHRCHIGFVPQGTFGPGGEMNGAAPVPQFHSMIHALARRTPA